VITTSNLSGDSAVPAETPLATQPPGALPVSFEELFVAQYPTMLRLAVLMNAEDPENVTQEAFARLHLRFDRMRDKGAASQYVRTTICNLARSNWRHRKVRDRTAPKLHTPDLDGPETHLLHSHEIAHALALVDKLPGRQREVVVLRYWAGLSETEIAQTLAISPGSVKTHAHRAMAALRHGMETYR
jgi:RNA polymerase sigma-70 factor (sigma-E family)